MLIFVNALGHGNRGWSVVILAPVWVPTMANPGIPEHMEGGVLGVFGVWAGISLILGLQSAKEK